MNEMASLKVKSCFWALVHGRKVLILKRESCMFYCPFFIGFLAFAVTVDVASLCIVENRSIKIDCRFCFPVLLTDNIRVGVIFCFISRSPMNITCHERPYPSVVHPYLSLKGYAPSSTSAAPPLDSLSRNGVRLPPSFYRRREMIQPE